MSASPDPGNVRTSTPLSVTFTHPELSNDGMMMLGSALELMELQDGPDGEPLKETLVVDLMESRPTTALVKITPRRPLTYDEIMDNVRLIAKRASKGITSNPLGIGKIVWENQRFGVPSDQKSNLRSV